VPVERLLATQSRAVVKEGLPYGSERSPRASRGKLGDAARETTSINAKFGS